MTEAVTEFVLLPHEQQRGWGACWDAAIDIIWIASIKRLTI